MGSTLFFLLDSDVIRVKFIMKIHQSIYIRNHYLTFHGRVLTNGNIERIFREKFIFYKNELLF